jgi:hypothetical protein
VDPQQPAGGAGVAQLVGEREHPQAEAVQAIIEGHGGASLLATWQVTQKDAPPWPLTSAPTAAVSRLLGDRTT